MRICTIVSIKGKLALSVFKARGLVLNERDAGESDKIVTLLLKEYGRLTVSARGARKPKSKFMAGAQLFTYSDFVIFKGKNFHALAQVDVIENFYALRGDYARLCYGHYFLELCDKTILESMACDALLRLLLLCLSALNKGRSPSLTARVFEIKFFQWQGLAPETEICSNCGGALTEPIYFSFGGALCENCRRPSAVRLSPAAAYAIRYVLAAPLNRLFQFDLADSALTELKMAARLFLRGHFDLTLKSLETLEQF